MLKEIWKRQPGVSQGSQAVRGAICIERERGAACLYWLASDQKTAFGGHKVQLVDVVGRVVFTRDLKQMK